MTTSGAGTAVAAAPARAHGGPVEPDEATWQRLVSEVLADPDRMQLVFQPIVSLQNAVIVGYEALARFPAPGLSPDRWFAAADRQGRGAALEAIAVRRCLDLRGQLPPNCFLTVNVSPHLLAGSELTGLLLGAGDLRPIVLELTEHQETVDTGTLVSLRNELAARGALLALDDAGAGYSGLQQMSQLRPHLIKMDRALVADADGDEVKQALAELLGQFGGRIDAWLLAEGIETWGECDAFLRLGVPLAQGYLLGRPAAPWAALAPATVERLKAGAGRIAVVEHVASLLDTVPIEGEDPISTGQIGLRVDEHRFPIALLAPMQREMDVPRHRVVPVSLRVSPSTSVPELALRLISRPEHCRFDPVVCVDDLGRALGLIRVERVLARLADSRKPDPPPTPLPAGFSRPLFLEAVVKQFSCGDVVPGCSQVFRGDTNDQILSQVATHAHRDHGLTEIPDALVEQVVAHIVAA